MYERPRESGVFCGYRDRPTRVLTLKEDASSQVRPVLCVVAGHGFHRVDDNDDAIGLSLFGLKEVTGANVFAIWIEQRFHLMSSNRSVLPFLSAALNQRGYPG